MLRIPRATLFGLTLAAININVAAAADDPIATALKAGNAKLAFALALERSNSEFGDPEFDFLYGMAAAQTANSEQAIFAFERVLLAQPDNLRARLELARAQYAVGDYDAAKQEFLLVQKQNPPANVQQRITDYLSAIERQQNAKKNQTQALASLSIGHDSNINSAPGIDNYATDTITLTPDAPEADQFYEVVAAANYVHNISKTRSACLSGNIVAHKNTSDSTFDTNGLMLLGCYNWSGLGLQWRGSGQAQWLTLDGDHFRDLYATGIDGSKPIGNGLQWNNSAQIGAMRYADQATRDVNFVTLSSALAWQPKTNHGTSLGLTLGIEDATDAENDANARRYAGMQGQWSWRIKPEHSLNLTPSYQFASYNDDYAFADKRRTDNTIATGINWSYAWRPNWTLVSEYRYSKTQSNIDLFSYDRNLLQFSIRYQTN